jgi:hypothetical protein
MKIIIDTDLGTDNVTLITVSSADTNFPATNMLNDFTTDVWKSNTGVYSAMLLVSVSKGSSIELFNTNAIEAIVEIGSGGSYELEDFTHELVYTYVKATTRFSSNYWPYYASDPALSLIDAALNNAWISSIGQATNQRVHIDLGSAKTLRQIYYENYHNTGSSTNAGVKGFTLWGSNNAAAFAELTYSIDTNWTQITCDATQFDQHVGANQADPHYIGVTNRTVYRYYAFKFADNWGANYMGLRRISLQTGPYALETGYTFEDTAIFATTAYDLPGTAGRLWGDYTEITTPHIIKVTLTSLSEITVGIVRAGIVQTFTDPAHGYTEDSIDYSIEKELNNGSNYFRKRNIVRTFSGLSLIDTRANCFIFKHDIFDAVGPKPLAIRINSNTLPDDEFVLFAKRTEPPKIVHDVSKTHSRIKISLKEVI